MEKIIEFLKNLFDRYIISGFHKVPGLIVAIFIHLCLALYAHDHLRDDVGYEKIVYVIVLLIIVLFWLFYRYRWPYPKNKKGKVGIVISIYANSYEGVRIKNKFKSELERNINDSDLGKYFRIIILSNQHSEKIKNKNDIEIAHKKVGGHIYFYGDIQCDLDGKDTKKYFLNIDGYVKHLPIPIPVSKDLSFDFRAVLPRDISFEDFFAFRGCKITARIIYLTTKYVVGVASFYSGNPFLALKMHNNLSKELDDYKEISKDRKTKNFTKFDLKKVKLIKNKLPSIISSEATAVARIYYINGVMGKAQRFLDEALRNDSNNYNALLLKAIFEFSIDDNSHGALETIKNAKRISKGRFFEWKYSWAFLKFWFEEYEEAYGMCKKIKNQNYALEGITVSEVKEFNLNILKRRKDKNQLYFWIGYLSYKKEHNLPDALKYFEKFLELADKKSMNFLIKKVDFFLREIKKEMQISD